MRRFLMAGLLASMVGCGVQTSTGVKLLPKELTNVQELSNGWRTADLKVRESKYTTTYRFIYHESDPGRLTEVGIVDTNMNDEPFFQ